MVVNAALPATLMSIPATSAHLWPAGNLPAGSVTYPGRIFVGGLASERSPEGEVSEKDLINFFGCFGTVTEVKKILDHEDGTFRGFAFVTFADKATADEVFKQYSDVSQRSRFSIKGLDLKIGHAVKKGTGSVAAVPNPTALMVASQMAQYQQHLYSQQVLAHLYPYYVGGNPLGTDSSLGLFYPNAAAYNSLQLTSAAATAAPVKLASSPIAQTASLNSPVKTSQFPYFTNITKYLF